MDLSIVIVNWNTRDYLERCLKSLYTYPPHAKFEILVVDNASTDGSAQMVREKFPTVTLLANSENVGYAQGNNQAIESAQGEFILLLNPDVEVKNGALDNLLEFGRAHPEAAAVGCRLVHPNGKVQRSCRSFPEPLGLLFEYTGISKLFPRSKLFGSYRMRYFDYAHEAEVDQPMGSCLLLSRRAIEDVGEFDNQFPIFFNEVDWCYRAKEKGWKIYFTPLAEVIHHGGASTSQAPAQMAVESHRALKRFYAKHYRNKLPIVVYWFIMLAITVNSFFVARMRSIGREKK
ncbi:MAG: glycosyltransferase family 2 protein [Armatimonadota bacterium]|nr:glycosyltransferase family 2 protein [Armatimonadota bacterium]